MALAIHNLLETVCNPAGRFKMLDGIEVARDEFDDPVFSVTGKTTCFPVRWGDSSYVLKCFVRSQQDSKMVFRQIAEYLERVTSPFLVDYVYLSEEMLVFNDNGESYYTDVILMEYPEGMKTLDEFMDEACERNDIPTLTRLLQEFCRMAVWIINDGIVHGAIRASNILVAEDCSVRLINYESMRVPPMGSTRPTVIDNDNIVVANLALGLKAVLSDPSLFHVLKGDSMFRLPIVRSSLLPMFSEAAEKAGCAPMKALVEMLATCNHTLHSRSELSEVLEALSVDTTSVDVDSVRLTLDEKKEEPSVPAASAPERLLPRNDLGKTYSWVGTMCESMICVQKNELWGYVNSEGEEVIPLKYKWAGDFDEGRAAVIETDAETYALIDKTGREILPPIYELVEWDGAHGVAKVSYEGLFGLYDRNGKEIVPLIYDWMGETANELILVRSTDGRCGYIRHNGEVAIPIEWDDAYDFEDGHALVFKNGDSFEIDVQGHRVA